MKAPKFVDWTKPGKYKVSARDFGHFDIPNAKNGWDAIKQAKDCIQEQGISLQGRGRWFEITDGPRKAIQPA